MKIDYFVVGEIQTNCYVVYNEESKDCFLVDPGDKDRFLSEFLKKNQLNVKYIILTHGHGDHTSGIPAIKTDYPDVKLIANRSERDFLYDRSKSFGMGGIKADIEVKDGEEMDICGAHLKFISTPGHTPGGMCILMDKTLFCGDTLFFGSVGRTDLPGGDYDQLMDSIKNKLFTLPDDTICYPGHMRETNIAFEKEYNPFV